MCRQLHAALLVIYLQDDGEAGRQCVCAMDEPKATDEEAGGAEAERSGGRCVRKCNGVVEERGCTGFL
jgi:hypothetical protein